MPKRKQKIIQGRFIVNETKTEIRHLPFEWQRIEYDKVIKQFIKQLKL